MSDAEARTEYVSAQSERIQALEAENVRLRAIVEELSPAPAEVVRLRQLLIEYGRHNEGCNAQFGDTYRCRCGWREVEPEFTAQEATEPPVSNP